MNTTQYTLHDPLIEEVRATRQRLVEEHGGLDGWIDHLQAEQKKQPEMLIDLPNKKKEPRI